MNEKLIEKLEKQNEVMFENINDLNNKVEEAIEYIENRFEYDKETGTYTLTATFDKDNVYELYKILKGEEE